MNYGDIQSAGQSRLRLSGVAVVLGVLLAAGAGYQFFDLGRDGGGSRIETALEADTASPDDADPGQTEPLNVQVPEGEDAKAMSSASIVNNSSDNSGDNAGDDPNDSSEPADDTSTTVNDAGNNDTGNASGDDTADGNDSSATTTASTTRQSTSTQRQTATTRRTTTTSRRTTTTQRTTTTRRTTTTQRATTTTRPTTTTTRRTTTTQPVTGNIVWVDSRASSGGNGSQSAPFRTINEGLLTVRAGETLMIKGGEYREFVNPGYRMPKGTSSSRINMRNAPGERVVIRGRVILTNIEYWTISGINVTWDNERNDRSVEHMVMLKGGNNWEFRDAEIWGAKAYSAILIGDNPRSFALRNLYVHDTYPTNDTNQDHLIYCACGTGGGIIERNLLVGSANGRAVKLGGANSSGGAIGNVVVRYNTMVDNRGPSNVQLSYNTSNITVERNIMVSTKDYATNLSTYQLSGSNNRASNNIGYDSPGVVENHGGIINGGGNVYRDPRLDSNYVPQDSQSKAYGHKAP